MYLSRLFSGSWVDGEASGSDEVQVVENTTTLAEASGSRTSLSSCFFINLLKTSAGQSGQSGQTGHSGQSDGTTLGQLIRGWPVGGGTELGFEDGGDLSPKHGNLCARRKPNDAPVYSEIRVNEYVAEGDDLRPGNLRMPVLQLHRKPGRRFTYHGEFVNYRAGNLVGLAQRCLVGNPVMNRAIESAASRMSSRYSDSCRIKES
jgi:hypothetical protein